MKHIYHSGETVPRGAYWNVSTGELIHCDAATEVLAGDSKTYLKVHPAVLLLLGPIIGLAFVLFLPFIGFAMITYTVASKVLSAASAHLAREAGFRWQPTMAYFTGKEHRGEKETKPSEPESHKA
jgi:hypothetical protein